LKVTELKILSELLKNSRRSDRELAKAVNVSQPTVSRIISVFEKEDIIKEYTVVPDFCKLGFQLLAVTFLDVEKEFDLQKLQKTFQNIVVIGRGLGLNYSHMVVSLHKDYPSYTEFEKGLKQTSLLKARNSASFLVDLKNGHGFFSLSVLSALLRNV
jgi:DNA-binding Lrp family transcriptional regulator